MSKTAKIQQLPLEFEPRAYLDKEDFMVAKCNIAALRRIDSWPNWSFFALCLYGPTGCGKSHLANIFSNQVSIVTNYPYKIPNIKAKDINLEDVHQLFHEHKCLIVEDLNENINQEAMFHLYNLYRNEGGYILFTSENAPARMNFSLADLRSRLNIIPSIEIGEPDDELLSALIVKLFTDRQIIISQEILNYILANIERSFSYTRKLVAEIDNISLSRKRAVSIPLVKEAIAYLSDDSQGDLFNA